MTIPPNIRTFTPENWPEWEKFERLYEGTYAKFSAHDRKAVLGVGSHYRKALRLITLAAKLAPNLVTDSEELAQQGHTSAANTKEFAAVIEAAYLELYSSVDCTRMVLVATLPKVRGMPRASTRKLFKWVFDGLTGDDFPSAARAAIMNADWYDVLRTLRDELTHGTLGLCHRDDRNGKISYIHFGVVRDGMPLNVIDLTAWLGELIGGVGRFMVEIFRLLNADLGTKPVEVECGFFHGHRFTRMLAMAETIDVNSGTCNSRIMFDREPKFRCPHADECGAYVRAEKGNSSPVLQST